MNASEAAQIAQRHLDSHPISNKPLKVYDDSVEDHGWCYLVHYNTARYLETRDMADTLPPGTGPVAINKDGSDVWLLGSADYEWQLDRYAKNHGISTGS